MIPSTRKAGLNSILASNQIPLWHYHLSSSALRIWVLGFVPADVVRLKKDVWFSKLNAEQVDSVKQFLSSSG